LYNILYNILLRKKKTWDLCVFCHYSNILVKSLRFSDLKYLIFSLSLSLCMGCRDSIEKKTIFFK
jgi:hypothetical protein